MSSGLKSQDLDITKVTPQQLMQLSKQLEQDVETLNASHQQIQTASQKFGDSKAVVHYLKEKAKGKEIMIPLTSSLYVPGIMEDNEQVLVEVGAGYFVEKSTEKAKEYCDKKIKMLNENGGKVAEIIQIKRLQLQKVQIEYQKRLEAIQKQMDQQKKQQQQ